MCSRKSNILYTISRIASVCMDVDLWHVCSIVKTNIILNCLSLCLSVDWALDNRYWEFLFCASLIDLCALSKEIYVYEKHSLPLNFTLASINLTACWIEIF